MTKVQLLNLIRKESRIVWDTLNRMYPKLSRYPRPEIRLNPYCWRTAGMCYQEWNEIELSFKFFDKHPAEMIQTVLPHELIHQVDWNLYGISEDKSGHGINWMQIMVEYGLPPERYHSMKVKR